jgi:hypothetical protein
MCNSFNKKFLDEAAKALQNSNINNPTFGVHISEKAVKITKKNKP